MVFLVEGVSEIGCIVMRENTKDFDLYELVKNNNYDAVVICYAIFMIGAQDDSNSANYRMFSFDNPD